MPPCLSYNIITLLIDYFHLSYEHRVEPGERETQGNCIALYKHFKGACSEARMGLFSMSQVKGWKEMALICARFRLDIRKRFLLKEYLGIGICSQGKWWSHHLERHLDVALGTWFGGNYGGGGLTAGLEVFSNLDDFVIQLKCSP